MYALRILEYLFLKILTNPYRNHNEKKILYNILWQELNMQKNQIFKEGAERSSS